MHECMGCISLIQNLETRDGFGIEMLGRGVDGRKMGGFVACLQILVFLSVYVHIYIGCLGLGNLDSH